MKGMMKHLCLALMCTVVAGCIGTDYVDDPVSPPSAARIAIVPSGVALQPGETVQLQALLVDPSGGGMIASGVLWSSSDTGIVSVSNAGLAMARQAGQARITARANNITSDGALITVVTDQNQVARVEVLPQSVQRRPGESQQFTATAYNINNQVIAGRPVAWSSSNTSVATITAAGMATAQSVGATSITAIIDGIESLPATLTVSANSRVGTFVMRPGSGHDVRGTATLSQQGNGSLILAFGSDFASAGGPDVRVYLSTTNTVGAGSLDLGRLQRYTGAQSYNVPSNVQLNTYDWVIIHCVPFNITFGYARLQ
jgi:uncharacterized protein YjdB